MTKTPLDMQNYSLLIWKHEVKSIQKLNSLGISVYSVKPVESHTCGWYDCPCSWYFVESNIAPNICGQDKYYYAIVTAIPWMLTTYW